VTENGSFEAEVSIPKAASPPSSYVTTGTEYLFYYTPEWNIIQLYRNHETFGKWVVCNITQQIAGQPAPSKSLKLVPVGNSLIAQGPSLDNFTR
jgi:hypothetical protein